MLDTYTTRAGDMWDSIAYQIMGDTAYTDELIAANLDYRHIYIFPAGITLAIPDISPQAAAANNLPPWKRL